MRTRCLLAAALVLGSAPAAHADDDDDDDNDWLGFGTLFLLHVGFQFGAGDAVSIAPDFTYLHRRFELGVLHSSGAITGFTGLVPAQSVCVHGDLCDAFSSPYHGGALQVQYDFSPHDFLIGLQAGAVIGDFDPFRPGIKLGAEVMYIGPDIVLITAHPNLIIAAADRGEVSDRLNLPVSIGAFTFVTVETGVTLPLDHASDQWQMPVTFKLAYPIADKFMVDAAVTFPAVVGGSAIDTDGGFDHAAFTFGVDLSSLINDL